MSVLGMSLDNLPEVLIFLVAGMDHFVAGGWQGCALRFLGLDIRRCRSGFLCQLLLIIKEPHISDVWILYPLISQV